MKSFEPNVMCVKQKSYRQRLPMPAFDEPIIKDRALKCIHNRNFDEVYGEIYCSKCWAVYDLLFVKDPEDKCGNTNLIVWDRTYDKSRWTNYSLELMQGKKNDDFTCQLWLELIRDVPDPFKWYDVYKVFQRSKLLKYWIAFGSYIGYGIKLNKKIMAHFNKYIDIGHGKYSISYFFLLYKFTQLFGQDPEDARFVPLKNSATWCKKTDIWWKDVCEEHGWKFIPTKIYKIDWNKEVFLKQYAYTVNKYIKDSLTYS